MAMVMKRFRLLVLLLVATLFVQSASATLAPMLESSYYDGYVFYGAEPDYTGGLKGRIDFAVYDDRDEYFSRNGLHAPGTGDYVYAYQIFNDYAVSEEAVAYFALLGINGATIDLDSIGSQEDPESGIEPGSAYFNDDESRIVWEFNGGAGYILAGDHSWLLVFSSDQDLVLGSYEIRAAENVPVPEPSVLALLGVGSVMILRRRKSKS